jgi:hypothetical protein
MLLVKSFAFGTTFLTCRRKNVIGSDLVQRWPRL